MMEMESQIHWMDVLWIQIKLLQVKAKSLLRLIKSGAATPQIEREVEEIEKRIADIAKLIEKESR